MLTVISPAKTLDFESPVGIRRSTQPSLSRDTAELVGIMKKQTPADLRKLMGISPKLAELNVCRYQDWSSKESREAARQAILAFRGDVYLGLQAEQFSPRDHTFAQRHLRILSGLYGVLKPLDAIQPYRLEMGTRLNTRRGGDLYRFWGDKVTRLLADDVAGHRNKALINLASNEYFSVVRPDLLPGSVITPVFKDYNKGTYKVLSFFAKKARGAMAAFIVQQRINKPEDIKAFDVDGYRYNDNLSSDNQWVFTRKA